MHDLFTQFLGAKFVEDAIHIGLKLLLALVVLLVGMWLIRRLTNVSVRAMKKASIDVMLSGFLRKVIYGTLIAVLAVVVLNQVGVSTAPLVTALGAAGLALGLALQGSLSNLAWGVLLVMFRPFRIGDFITADGIDGTVNEISLMHTILRLPDGREAILPNGKVGSGAIINYNRLGTRRFELQVAIGYKNDIGKAMDEIRQLFEKDQRILKEPAPGVWTAALVESSVELIVRGWTSPEDFWQTKADFLKAIKDQFGQAGITIPFPQRELTMIQGELTGSPSNQS